jgi:RDD family
MSSSKIAQRRLARGNWAARPANLHAPEASVSVRLRAFALTCLLFVITLGVGWLAWSIVEWRHGRTVSYRCTGLRVVASADGRPVGLGRSVLRSALCCTVLLIPTVLVCVLLALAFVMGASPPNDLLTKPRRAPWDVLTGTDVLDERSHIVGLAPFAPAPSARTGSAGMN